MSHRRLSRLSESYKPKRADATVEEKQRAARVLLSLVGRKERRRQGRPKLEVVDGGQGRAA